MPPSQWVRMGQPVRCWAMAAAAKTFSSRALGPPVEPAIFMTPARCGGALDDGPGVVELVDAVLDVGHEEAGDLLGREAHAPVAVVVVALVVKARWSDDVDAAAPRDLGQQQHVAAAVGGHGIHDGAQAQGLGGRQLGHGLVHVGELEVREELDRPAAVDDEVLVGVDDAQLLGGDVAEDGAGEGHGSGSFQDAAIGRVGGADVGQWRPASSAACMTRATAPRTPAWSERSARRMGMMRSLG